MTNISRRDFLKVASAGVAVMAMPSVVLKAAEGKKPNFVFILIDDMGQRDVGCYGSKIHETPNIDKLASQGMMFTDGYAACPVCSPTRASILTGKYPARLHLTDWIAGHVKPKAKLNLIEKGTQTATSLFYPQERGPPGSTIPMPQPFPR